MPINKRGVPRLTPIISLDRIFRWEQNQVEVNTQFGIGRAQDFVEARRHPRYKLQVDIRVYARNARVVRGHTVDISERGISALFAVEVPVGEVVRLEFSLPMGDIETHALVCHRSAFRYGLQFVESSGEPDVISRTCGQLAMEESLRQAKRS
jgi:hypothetical protein